MKLPLITNIQRYSIHDGDGIRTTVFFKGCPMACQWCHNPETQEFDAEPMRNPDRCGGCGRCAALCPEGAISLKDGLAVTDRSKCVRCGECVDECYNEARTISGRSYEVEELVRILVRDQMFAEVSGGGVTLSGGEVMAQDMDYITALMRRLEEKGISVNIDTCGFVPFANYERVLPYADVFLYDIKAMDDEVHRKYTGVSNRLILENLAELGRRGAKLYIRMPLIAGVNDSEEDVGRAIAFLRENAVPVRQVNLLPYHELGQDKLEKLGKVRVDHGFRPPEKAHLEELAALFRTNGFLNTKIGG
ncbi:MAG: glycyl-radical enzyme activating protein [Oscillospiraceae bacterium]